MDRSDFEYADQSQQLFAVILSSHLEEARSRAFSLAAEGTIEETGSIETPRSDARKARFKGRQMPLSQERLKPRTN